MNTIYNFSPGPAMLPRVVEEATAAAVLCYEPAGYSILGLGHRTPQFADIMSEAQDLMCELLNIPSGYTVLFLGGGARMQFDMIPMNLLRHKAAFLDTGHWAHQAMQAARLWGNTEVVASSAEDNYSHLPHTYNVPADADYLHVTTNNTIYGTQLRTDVDAPIPLVADMSSDVLTRAIDVSRYDLIYGGAQKNLSMAGVTFVIVRNGAVGHSGRTLPAMLNYATHIKYGSLYNTPPVLAVYTALEMLRWIKREGGVGEMECRAQQRASLLYAEVERNALFRPTVEVKADRSLTNVCFVMNDAYKKHEDEFIRFAVSKGLVGLKGHRLVGGLRASIYNGMPVEGVQRLVECMQTFERNVFAIG